MSTYLKACVREKYPDHKFYSNRKVTRGITKSTVALAKFGLSDNPTVSVSVIAVAARTDQWDNKVLPVHIFLNLFTKILIKNY